MTPLISYIYTQKIIWHDVILYIYIYKITSCHMIFCVYIYDISGVMMGLMSCVPGTGSFDNTICIYIYTYSVVKRPGTSVPSRY